MWLGFAAAAVVAGILVARQWSEIHSKDMGTMSRQWLAEYNAQNP